MSANNYKDLFRHYGHKIDMVIYGNKNNPDNVAIECDDCSEVLLSFDYAEHRCDNCDRQFVTSELKIRWPHIPKLDIRIEPGSEVPSGECPKCGALTYLIK